MDCDTFVELEVYAGGQDLREAATLLSRLDLCGFTQPLYDLWNQDRLRFHIRSAEEDGLQLAMNNSVGQIIEGALRALDIPDLDKVETFEEEGKYFVDLVTLAAFTEEAQKAGKMGDVNKAVMDALKAYPSDKLLLFLSMKASTGRSLYTIAELEAEVGSVRDELKSQLSGESGRKADAILGAIKGWFKDNDVDGDSMVDIRSLYSDQSGVIKRVINLSADESGELQFTMSDLMASQQIFQDLADKYMPNVHY